MSRNVTLVIHSTEKVNLTPIPYDKYALEEALELPVIHGSNRKVCLVVCYIILELFTIYTDLLVITIFYFLR